MQYQRIYQIDLKSIKNISLIHASPDAFDCLYNSRFIIGYNTQSKSTKRPKIYFLSIKGKGILEK